MDWTLFLIRRIRLKMDNLWSISFVFTLLWLQFLKYFCFNVSNKTSTFKSQPINFWIEYIFNKYYTIYIDRILLFQTFPL